MPNRPDIRDLAANVRQAFEAMDRDALLDILTFVVKEYVVEGPPPTLIHQAETLADLTPANFGQLIAALQTRFDFPELAMFVVEENSVGVRIGGVVQPLVAQRAPLTGTMPGTQQMTAPSGPARVIDTRPAAESAESAQAERPERSSPGVRVVETPLQQRPPRSASAPPPARGLSVRGRTSEPAAPPATADAPASPPAASAPTSAANSAPAEKADKPEGSGDDASARFSLLELD